MNKAEAIQALESGEKVSHRLFSSDEYIYRDSDGFYRDEKAYNLGFEGDRFWKYRKGLWWEGDWFLYEKVTL